MEWLLEQKSEVRICMFNLFRRKKDDNFAEDVIMHIPKLSLSVDKGEITIEDAQKELDKLMASASESQRELIREKVDDLQKLFSSYGID